MTKPKTSAPVVSIATAAERAAHRNAAPSPPKPPPLAKVKPDASALPRASHEATMKIGEATFRCYILPGPNGTHVRVLSLRDTLRAVGATGRDADAVLSKNIEKSGVRKLDVLDHENDKIANDSGDLGGVRKLQFLPSRGGVPVTGYTTAQVIQFLRDWSGRHARGELRENQKHIGLSATLTLGALAGIGLESMVDEACGFSTKETKNDAFSRWFRELRNLDVERILGAGFMVGVCRLYGWDYTPGERPPIGLRGFMGQFYKCVLGDEQYERFKEVCDAAKNPDEFRNRMYQFLTDHPLNFVRDTLIVAEAFAKTSRTPADFWNKMYAYTRGQGYQFTMGF